MLCFKICRGEFTFQFGIDSRYRESDTSQHVIRCDPIDMILVHLGSYDDPVIFVVIATPAPGRSALLDSFCVTGSIFIRDGLICDRVRVVRSGGSTGKAHRSPTDTSRRG